MTRTKLRTAVIGFGQVAQGYADDPLMARHYPFATHAQVLAAHPAFDWVAVVDPSPTARDAASRWNVPHAVADVDALGAVAGAIEVAVFATPPGVRLSFLESLPALRAVIVEKPLGRNLAESEEFVRVCRERGILVEVNFWRRADKQFRALAGGKLRDLVGDVQCAFGVYGNGLLNNGLHLVDFVRMLLGEIDSVEWSSSDAPVAGPIAGDVNPSFVLALHASKVFAHPVRFDAYREVGLDIWGEKGRLAIYNEGLTIAHFPRAANRAMRGESEIEFDSPSYLQSTVGDAFYEMFTNVADALEGTAPLFSDGESALRSSAVVEAVAAAESRLQSSRTAIKLS
jgi:predicted dehydrogenase